MTALTQPRKFTETPASSVSTDAGEAALRRPGAGGPSCLAADLEQLLAAGRAWCRTLDAAFERDGRVRPTGRRYRSDLFAMPPID